MQSSALVVLLGVASFVLLAVPLATLAWSTMGRAADGPRGSPGGKSGALLLCGTVCFGLFFLRPQEHTFTGLDVSGYRLMAGALAGGRELKGVDAALAELPRPIRSLVLYRPEYYKTTRDQSFAISSMETCRTRPFYYPLLPLSMIGFDRLVPGQARDYLIPLIGLLLFVTLLRASVARAGVLGAVVTGVFAVGSLFPVWFFRGAFPESAGIALVAACVLWWTTREKDSGVVRYFAAFALGLAVSYHPLMIVLALPTLAAMLFMAGDLRPGVFVLSLLSFAAGMIPLLLMTEFVTAPYGRIALRNPVIWWQRSPPMRPVILATGITAVLFAFALCFRRFLLEKVRSAEARRPLLVPFALFALWSVPTVASALLPVHGKVVQHGLLDLFGGLRLGFGVILAAAAAAIAFSRESGRARAAASIAFMTLPVFLYLKGVEKTGLWQQRRLLPFVILAVVISAPVFAEVLKRLAAAAHLKRTGVAAVAACLLVAGLSNAVRWPAPYLVRQERGADAWVDRMMDRFGSDLVVFDYHPWSIPLAVRGTGRVFGFGPYAFDRIGEFVQWIAAAARNETVYLLSAYGGGWVEEGVSLEEVGREKLSLEVVRGKQSFPSVKDERVVDLRVLRVTPAGSGPPAVMERALDGGEFGLRPPWGRRDVGIKMGDGSRLPAFWSREGSGVVGPVPPPGGSLHVSLWAGAYRRGGPERQVVRIVPPWEGPPLTLEVANDYGLTGGLLQRPAGGKGVQGGTGTYRIYAEKPYDPGRDGIGGFSGDLGVLIHKVRMELANTAPPGS